jgi:23S rRNA (uracil1939-C5)-methyltransferase
VSLSGAPPDPGLVCEHEAACSGCPLMRLSYEAQLLRKRDRLTEALALYPRLSPIHVRDVAPADPRSHYRTRAKLVVGHDAELGLFEPGHAHTVVDIPGCIVLSPLLTRVARVVRGMLASAALPPLREADKGGVVALDLREVVAPIAEESAVRALVTFVVVRGAAVPLEALRHAAEALRQDVPETIGVAVSYREPDAPQLLGPETHLLSGRSSVHDTVGDVAHSATFGSFVQAHRGQARAIHERIASALVGTRGDGAPPLRVLDLYGGSGAIALALAKRGAVVHLVESFGPAAAAARDEAAKSDLRLTAEAADVEDALLRLSRSRTPFDAAVVNPPRRGLSPGVRSLLARLSIGTLVYVSCHPETLVRDLAHLARLGLKAADLEPFDMIPLTREVETLAVLERAPREPPVVLYEDDDVIAVDKPPYEPTTPQGEHETSLLAAVQSLLRAPGAVAVQRLDVGTSGVVLFAREPSRAHAWSTALGAGDAEKTYLAAVRGVPEAAGVIDTSLVIVGTKKRARTTFERHETWGGHALLRVVPQEGRTHQIRRHLASRGHPVLGDARYGHAATNRFFLEKHGLDRTFLHAARLELRHPVTRKLLVIESTLPGDLEAVWQSVAEG